MKYFSNSLVEDAFLQYVILFCKYHEGQESQISETSGSLTTCRKIIFTNVMRHFMFSCNFFLFISMCNNRNFSINDNICSQVNMVNCLLHYGNKQAVMLSW